MNAFLAHERLPNALTLLRVLLVPVFAWFLFRSTKADAIFAAMIFLFAAITDFVDGYLARKHRTVSSFGKLADPIADKALTGVAFIGLSINYDLPWWMTIAMLGRELVVTVARLLIKGKQIVAANLGGKVKTVVQIVAVIAWLLASVVPLGNLPLIALWTALAITLGTGIWYLRDIWAIRGT